MQAHQDKAAGVHVLQDLFEFRPGGHDLVVVVLLVVPVKGAGVVHDQDMEEYVGDFLGILTHQSGFRLLIGGDGCLYIFAVRDVGALKKLYGAVIVVHGRHPGCRIQSILPGFLGGDGFFGSSFRFRKVSFRDLRNGIRGCCTMASAEGQDRGNHAENGEDGNKKLVAPQKTDKRGTFRAALSLSGRRLLR